MLKLICMPCTSGCALVSTEHLGCSLLQHRQHVVTSFRLLLSSNTYPLQAWASNDTDLNDDVLAIAVMIP